MWFIKETLAQVVWSAIVFASVVGAVYLYTHHFAKCSEVLRMCVLGW